MLSNRVYSNLSTSHPFLKKPNYTYKRHLAFNQFEIKYITFLIVYFIYSFHKKLNFIAIFLSFHQYIFKNRGILQLRIF